jgi:glycosyltransferase involved in cell wall biosynthesis
MGERLTGSEERGHGGSVRVKILHLFSDWKWTGPAEPVLNLCKGLEKKGHDVTLAYRKPPYPIEESLERRVQEEGIKATDQFRLNHELKLSMPSFLRDTLHDVSHLSHYLRKERFDILNVHHSHDHVLGGIAAWRAACPTVVIRTDHKRNSIKPSVGNRALMSRLTDGIITFSEKSRREAVDRFSLPLERVGKVFPALSLERYQQKREWKDMRALFGIEPTDVVIGMVARFQKYRRTDVFLEAMKRVVKAFPKVKLLLVGRSSQMEASVLQPLKKLGIEPWVILAGYRTDDYIDTLACMDIFAFLMPGSDGTARALREAMALGKPVVVSDQGMLPELVQQGVSGWVVKMSPEGLADAVLKLLRSAELREAMGKAALQRAHEDFRLDQQVDAVDEFYRKVMSLGKRRN